MAGASTQAAGRRLTLGKRTNQPTALETMTGDAGIELFGSSLVRVRLPDVGVNAHSDATD